MKYLLIALLTLSCASKPPKDPGANSKAGKQAESKTVSMESKLLASEEETKYVTEITFPKKGKTISKSARREIRELYQKAHKKGEIDMVKVITWADSEYPSVYQGQLSSDERKLVDARNENVETYLKNLNQSLEVEKISMAERPDAWDKLMANDDYKAKKSLETAGLPNTDTSVKVPAKASKSIVIFLMKK